MSLNKTSDQAGMGCLFGMVGSFCGIALANQSFRLYAAQLRAADPGATICGLPAVAGMFWGAFLGGMIGMFVGMILCQLPLWWSGKANAEKRLNDSSGSLRLDFTDAQAWCGRGLVRFWKGEIDKAIEDFTIAIRCDPQCVLAYVYRATAWEKAGEFSSALSDYDTVISLDPQRALTYNHIAWLKATCPDDGFRNGKEAVEYATKACELTTWEVWQYTATLAAAYAESGDFTNAIRWQEKVIELAPQSEQKNVAQCLDRYLARKPYRSPPLK